MCAHKFIVFAAFLFTVGNAVPLLDSYNALLAGRILYVVFLISGGSLECGEAGVQWGRCRARATPQVWTGLRDGEWRGPIRAHGASSGTCCVRTRVRVRAEDAGALARWLPQTRCRRVCVCAQAQWFEHDPTLRYATVVAVSLSIFRLAGFAAFAVRPRARPPCTGPQTRSRRCCRVWAACTTPSCSRSAWPSGRRSFASVRAACLMRTGSLRLAAVVVFYSWRYSHFLRHGPPVVSTESKPSLRDLLHLNSLFWSAAGPACLSLPCSGARPRRGLAVITFLLYTSILSFVAYVVPLIEERFHQFDAADGASCSPLTALS